MKRHGIPILIAAAAAIAGCSPSYESGKTQCSTKKECPSGFSCSDNGTTGPLYCVDNKKLGCPSTSTFYCSQSNTCWAKPGACSTVTYCGTTQHPGNVICVSPDYHPDCYGDSCLPNSPVAGSGGRDGGAGGAIGTGGATARGGAGGTTIVIGSGGRTGYGGATGYGGTIGYGGSIGAGGIRDAGPEVPGVGGFYVTGGVVARGGVYGSGGLYASGGTMGRGGATGSGGVRGTGGSTGASACSGTTYDCSYRTSAEECGLANGCVWSTTTGICGGTALPCSSYTSSAWCVYNSCTWSGAMTCTPTPMTPYCSSMIDVDSDACDVCISGACCEQLTNCLNDEMCFGELSGPLWQRYLECVINCCGSSSACDWY
jgi:hypothetical protein